MRSIAKIYVHCSYSPYGNALWLDNVHKAKGWKMIGYHFVVLNPFATKTAWDNYRETGLFTSTTDGEVQLGRSLDLIGAHVLGDNDQSIGVCYIGVSPTVAQWSALMALCARLCREFNLTADNVLGHHEWFKNNNQPMMKTCPNFNMEAFRDALRNYTESP